MFHKVDIAVGSYRKDSVSQVTVKVLPEHARLRQADPHYVSVSNKKVDEVTFEVHLLVLFLLHVRRTAKTIKPK